MRRIRLPLSTALSLAAAATAASAGAATVFDSGTEGYNTYRIPAIVRTAGGSLLAFAEGRRNSASDAGDIDVVLKRSTDGGLTWGPLMVAQDEGVQTIGNPVPIVDESTGRVHLLFCRNNDRVFSTYSDDDGATWSERREITPAVKLPTWTWYATGPGHGIQLMRGQQAGRLVVASDHVAASGTKGMQVVYSDDHGLNWQLGGVATAANGINPNENLAVELVQPAESGGSRLFFAIRDQSGTAAGNRSEAWSADGGTTYQLPITNDTSLITPVVQGSVARLAAVDEGDLRNVILFSCPNAGTRTNMSLWYSTDEAATWSAPRSVYPGSSAYSDMVPLGDGRMGLLFEKDSYGFIDFQPIVPAFLGLAPEPALTWTGTAPGASWSDAANWGGSVPSFTGETGVAIGSASATSLGGDRTVRRISFTAAVDGAFSLQLTDTSGAARILTLQNSATDAGNRAAIRVDRGAGGAITIGSGVGSVALNDPLWIDHRGSGLLTIASPITSGSNGVTKAGAGRLVLAGTCTYAGPTRVEEGTLALQGGLSAASDITIATHATFSLESDASQVAWINRIFGSGTLVKLNRSTEYGLSGTCSFSGCIDIREGKIAFAGADSVNGKPSVSVASGATLSIGGGFAGRTATIGSLSGAGVVDTAFNSVSGTRTLRIDQAKEAVFTGAFRNGSVSRVLAVVKAGTATLMLSGTGSTHTGGTMIEEGELRLTGARTLAASRVMPLAGGTLAIADGLRCTVGGLVTNGGGVVDLGSGMLTVSTGLATSELLAALATGRGDGSWNGTSGITSGEAAASGGSRTVGWLDNGAGSVSVAYAAPGDTNLDWVVDILDVSNFVAGGRLDSALPARWVDGDFTFDGTVDILDAANFLSTGLYDAGSYNGGGQADPIITVPEPRTGIMTVATAVGVIALLAARSRAGDRDCLTPELGREAMRNARIALLTVVPKIATKSRHIP